MDLQYYDVIFALLPIVANNIKSFAGQIKVTRACITLKEEEQQTPSFSIIDRFHTHANKINYFFMTA